MFSKGGKNQLQEGTSFLAENAEGAELLTVNHKLTSTAHTTSGTLINTRS